MPPPRRRYGVAWGVIGAPRPCAFELAYAFDLREEPRADYGGKRSLSARITGSIQAGVLRRTLLEIAAAQLAALEVSKHKEDTRSARSSVR